MPGFFPSAPRDKEAQVESLVAEVFRNGGWRVFEQPVAGQGKADLIAEYAGKKYVVEIKRSSEGRKDRLIPLASQAILQAQEAARKMPGGRCCDRRGQLHSGGHCRASEAVCAATCAGYRRRSDGLRGLTVL